MVEKKFFLESESDLQRIGFRAQIVSFLIENGIERGNCSNDISNKNKVIVAIRFDSTPANSEIEIKEIDRIKEKLIIYLNGLSKSDPECYSRIPDNITASKLMDLSNPQPIAIMDLQKLSASLMLEQTSKGVGAMLNLSERIENAMLKLDKRMENLTDKIEKAFEPLSALPAILEKLTDKK